MFILGYIAIVILRANEVVIPGWVSLVIGIIAIAEGLLYIAVIILQIIAIFYVHRK